MSDEFFQNSFSEREIVISTLQISMFFDYVCNSFSHLLFCFLFRSDGMKIVLMGKYVNFLSFTIVYKIIYVFLQKHNLQYWGFCRESTFYYIYNFIKKMISLFDLTHRFKRSMLEITSETSYDILDKYLDPSQTEKLPDDVCFKVAAGKKDYDIIRYYEVGWEFYSQKIIDVLSQFVDMSDKCYPVKIEGVEKQYYVIYNLKTYPFWNTDDVVSAYDDPYYFGINDKSIPIFGIDDTAFIIVSEEIKDALLKSKISNIELIEHFGCSFEEYEKIKESNFKPQIHIYEDK